MTKSTQLKGFDFAPGFEIQKKYRIVKKLGGGWESEVYSVEEISTGITRAAKFFFPHRNKNNKSAKFYAKKLHKLRSCPVLIQYLTQDIMRYRGIPVSYLVSDYVDGQPLCDWLDNKKGKRISPFQALHLTHALAAGVEEIHRLKEYHGDIHTGNIIVQRHGLGFELKLLDFFNHGAANKDNYQSDLLNLIRVFYDAIGGQKYYSKQPQEVKDIICGLKSNLILKKFKNVMRLRSYIENMEWES